MKMDDCGYNKKALLNIAECGFCKHWDLYSGYCDAVDNFKCESETCDQFKQRGNMLELEFTPELKESYDKLKPNKEGGRFNITLDDAVWNLFRKD